MSTKMVNLVQAHYGDFESEDDEQRRKSALPPAPIAPAAPPTHSSQPPIGRLYSQEMRSLNAFERHQRLMALYDSSRYKSTVAVSASALPEVSDMQLLRSEHKFLMNDAQLADRSTPEKRMALHYYQKLWKEYCLADFSRYREGRVGLRWRTEAEVKSGKGQFICGNKKCAEREGLRSYECNFAYTDVAGGPPQAALVKIRLCPNCAYKMHYQKIKQAQRELRAKRREEKHAERKRRRTESVKTAESSSSESEADSSEDDTEVGSKRSNGNTATASTERRRSDKSSAIESVLKKYDRTGSSDLSEPLVAPPKDSFSIGMRAAQSFASSAQAHSTAEPPRPVPRNSEEQEWEDFERKLLSSLLV